MSARKKMTVLLTEDFHSDLQKRADDKGMNMGDYIRRAVAFQMYLDDNHGRLVLERDNGEKSELVTV